VIILIIDNIYVVVLEFKNDTPVFAYVNCPQTLSITFQRMQAKAWQIHIFNAGWGIHGGQAHSELLLVISLNPCNTARIEKLLQAFVFECFDHAIYYTAYCAIRNNFFTRYSIDSITLQNVILGALTQNSTARLFLRLLECLVGLLFRVSWPKSFQHGVVLSVEGLKLRVLSLSGSSQDGICKADAV